MIPSVSISVCTPRLRTPLSNSSEHTAFGIPPMPICRQAPFDLAGDQAGDGPVDLGWRRAREFGSRLVIALDQIINFASMYAILLAIHVGQTLGHLDDDQLGALDNRALPKVHSTEIEKAILIHRTGLEHCDIDRINEAPVIIGNFPEIAGNV